MSDGVLVDRELHRLFAEGAIRLAEGAPPLVKGQIQPASMDLRLGPKAYRVQATMLPGPGGKVMERIRPLIMAEVDLTRPQLLERGAVYVVPLLEGLKLDVSLLANSSPKSSTGRLDIFVRMLTDGGSIYDSVSEGYEGPLFLEIMPLTFSVVVRMGDRLNQLRVRRGPTVCGDAELHEIHGNTPLIYSAEKGQEHEPAHMADGLWMSIDLKGRSGAAGDSIVGYRAKRHTQPIDLERIQYYVWQEFWEPLRVTDCRPLILYPGEFYIFVSRERLRVPPRLSAELVAYDTRVGELRLHYAGFFDPGFGHDPAGEEHGTAAVLEVRAHDVACVLEHGQRMGRFVYERLTGEPDTLYGHSIGSNYAGQGLKLAKQFRME